MAFILFEDQDWLAVHKPLGLSTHAQDLGRIGLAEWIELHLLKKVHIISRLDKDTSGLILFAKNKESATRSLEISEKNLSRKSYLFLSHREPAAKTWDISTPINGKSASTHFRLHGKVPAGYLIEASFHGGRTHQVRIHANESETPILGDKLYGGKPFPRLALHSWKIQWPELPEPLECPIPDSFSEEPNLSEIQSLRERRLPMLTSVTHAFRLLHRGEWHRDWAIDYFQPFAVLWDYEPRETSPESVSGSEPETTKILELIQTLCGDLPLHGVVVKQTYKNPHRKGLDQPIPLWGEIPKSGLSVKEHGRHHEIQLHDPGHIGLFLDQRDNRQWVYLNSRGKSVLNLFSFTGSFSLAAKLGGARTITNIDNTRSTHPWFERNLQLNGIQTPCDDLKLHTDDVREWLERSKRRLASGKLSPFDIILCDPPTYSNQKGNAFKGLESARDLLSSCIELLAPFGHVVFSINDQRSDVRLVLELAQSFGKAILCDLPCDFPIPTKECPHLKRQSTTVRIQKV